MIFIIYIVGLIATIIGSCIWYVKYSEDNAEIFGVTIPIAVLWPISLLGLLMCILGEKVITKLNKMRQARVDKVKLDELKKEQDKKENVVIY